MNVQLAAKSALEYYNSGNLEKSEQLCKKILKRQDKNHYILNLLGLIYLKRKDYDSAIYYFEKSISINPSYTEAHCNLGLVLMKKGDLDTAMTHFKKAAEINPLMSEAWGNMGSALYQKGLIEDALEYYKKALKLNPTLAENWLNMGTCLIDIGRPREAIQYLQKAIEIKPEYPLAHFNLSFARLLLGDFKRGWFEYMWRWGLEEFQIPQFPQPLWDGSYLAGKTIYIHGEQGFGDSIQFIRYIPLVVERGGRVIVAVQKVLLQLIKSVEGISELITEGDPLPQFDVHCPLAGLPLAFETNLETIPSKVPYLSVDSGLIKKWGERLHSDKGILKVGLAWAGSQFHKKDLFRSINLEQFAPLAEIGDIVFYSLQKGRGSEQAKNPPKGMKLVDLMDEVQDFSDTAAIIENLDLVISVDTAVAHLAGALGKPVWTLLPFAPDWRWMLGREDSPWYPTMRLFRQPALRDWDSVIRRVADELRELSKGKTINITQEEKVEKELSTNTSSQITSEGDQILMEKETKDVGREDIAIILQCEGMGDCLFAMAVIKKLYIMDGMNSKFILFTHNPHLFQKCPYVEKVYHIHNMAERSKYKKAIILFDTTKLAFWTVDTFNFISIPLGIGELSFREKQLEYFPVEEDKSQHFDVVINTSITWPCRSWPIENWQKVADYILEKGYSVAVVGKDTFSKADNMWKRSYGLKGCVDLTNKLSLDQTYYTIKNSKLFITCQNGLSVLSGATDSEIIILGTSREWSKYAIYRNEDPHYKVTYVKGNCQLYCCSSFECPIYGEFRCIPTVEQVLEVVEQKLSATKTEGINRGNLQSVNEFRMPPYGRYESFDLVKNIITSNEYRNPLILEIGMTRKIGNWFGDGYSTPFFAYLVNITEGELYSIDIDPHAKMNCEHILNEYHLYTNRVHLIIEDALSFLSKWGSDYGKPVDLLYLDAWDYIEGESARISEENHLKALKLIEDYLSNRALILIDDIHDTKTLKGKGRLVIPYLKEKGYKLLYLGYQCLFVRDG